MSDPRQSPPNPDYCPTFNGNACDERACSCYWQKRAERFEGALREISKMNIGEKQIEIQMGGVADDALRGMENG